MAARLVTERKIPLTMAILLFRYTNSRVRQEISKPKCVRICVFLNNGEEK